MVLLLSRRALFNDCGAACTENLVGQFRIVDRAREHEAADAHSDGWDGAAAVRKIGFELLANHINQTAQTLLEDNTRRSADPADLRSKSGHGASEFGMVAMGL